LFAVQQKGQIRRVNGCRAPATGLLVVRDTTIDLPHADQVVVARRFPRFVGHAATTDGAAGAITAAGSGTWELSLREQQA